MDPDEIRLDEPTAAISEAIDAEFLSEGLDDDTEADLGVATATETTP